MTTNEWQSSHPEQCQAYVDAWKEKEQRENIRSASLQLITAIAGGVKIKNRAPRFDDFMRIEKKKVDPKLREIQLKIGFMAMAKKQQKKKENG